MVHELLNVGESAAITGRELSGLLNVTMRELGQIIETERRAGAPICASSGNNPGYYLADSKETMQDYCKSLEHREKEIGKTRRACMKTIKALPDRGTP